MLLNLAGSSCSAQTLRLGGGTRSCSTSRARLFWHRAAAGGHQSDDPAVSRVPGTHDARQRRHHGSLCSLRSAGRIWIAPPRSLVGVHGPAGSAGRKPCVGHNSRHSSSLCLGARRTAGRPGASRVGGRLILRCLGSCTEGSCSRQWEVAPPAPSWAGCYPNSGIRLEHRQLFIS